MSISSDSQPHSVSDSNTEHSHYQTWGNYSNCRMWLGVEVEHWRISRGSWWW